MLTIDRIVEKYRSLDSEKTVAANLRRSGMSAAAIEDFIAQHREHAGTDDERKQQVERFRAELVGLSRDEQITRYLWLFGSYEPRTIRLWEATVDEPADIFWRVLLEDWCVYDGMWPIRQIMLSTLRGRVRDLSPIEFMTPANRGFYTSLPDPVTVFRGCSRRRVRGLSWTTDRTIAAFFARRAVFLFRTPDPVIACAEIAKADLFFVCEDRNESEVVLDPYAVKRLRLQPAPTGADQ